MVAIASDRKKLFLSMDPSWNGQGFNITLPARYQIKAQDFIEYLPKYLQHAHGDTVFSGSPWMWWKKPKAKAMGWNEALQQPISQDGINLKANIQLLDFNWCQGVKQPTAKAATSMDLDNLSLPSF